MGKQKLILISESENREKVKQSITSFVENRYWGGKETTQKDILNVFKDRPYLLSQGTVSNYLSDLVSKRKLSTSYKDGHRYYTPPKLPIPVKFGIISSLTIISLFTFLNQVLSEDIIVKFYFADIHSNPSHITLFPVMIFLLIGFVVTSIVWYLTEREKTKNI